MGSGRSRPARVAILWILIMSPVLPGQAGPVPREPVEIGTNPQFFIDDYIVDNRWALNYRRESPEMVLRVFHPMQKHPDNPLIDMGKDGPSWPSVLRDPDTGRFRLWYQANLLVEDPKPGTGGVYRVGIAYGESDDGIHWRLPNLGILRGPHPGSAKRDVWKGSKENNFVWRGVSKRRGTGAYVPDATQIPLEARRGYKYVMFNLDLDGGHLVGSHDGIHWDPSSDVRLFTMHSDFPNSIIYDPDRKEYVLYCRAKHIYRAGQKGGVLNTGASRRIARMASKELWTEWRSEPQTILIPDELDNREGFNFFYNMTAYRHAGIYWAFLGPFKWNTEVRSELAFSRDSIHFQRLPSRPQVLPLGADDSWDSDMIFPAYQWVEVGEEWWMYYSGWNGPHGVRENLEKGIWRTGGIGLATIRKEGFISMRGPENGGVIATRKIRWPGGRLFINADARGGELKVRVSDSRRKPYPGLDYRDCAPFSGDEVSHEVKWEHRSIESLANQIVRLEFLLTRADLYTFRAGGGPTGGRPASSQD